MVQDPREQTLRWIQQLAAIERPSASPGERRAAEWVVEQLGEAATPARIEAEAAHGKHLPFVLPSALALLAGLVRSRPVVFVSHHDAARPWAAAFGAIVSAPPPRLLGGRPLPIAGTLAYAPLTVLLGVAGRVRALRRAGIALCAFIVVLFADIARRAPVPGANDNASGVAALLGIARDLSGSRGPASLRVVLLSAGSEETMLEGMDAFLRRHRGELDPARTIVVCLDQLGWVRLLLRDGEGVLRRYRTRPEDVDLLLHAARSAAVRIEVAPPFVSPSDGLAARWAGLPTIFLSSAATGGGYPNYHRPGDVPENVSIETVVAARRLCTQLVAELEMPP